MLTAQYVTVARTRLDLQCPFVPSVSVFLCFFVSSSLHLFACPSEVFVSVSMCVFVLLLARKSTSQMTWLPGSANPDFL